MCDWNHTTQAMLKCSQPSPIMLLQHIRKPIPFLSPVLYIPSLYYTFFNSETFYLLVKFRFRISYHIPATVWCFSSTVYLFKLPVDHLAYSIRHINLSFSDHRHHVSNSQHSHHHSAHSNMALQFNTLAISCKPKATTALTNESYSQHWHCNFGVSAKQF